MSDTTLSVLMSDTRLSVSRLMSDTRLSVSRLMSDTRLSVPRFRHEALRVGQRVELLLVAELPYLVVDGDGGQRQEAHDAHTGHHVRHDQTDRVAATRLHVGTLGQRGRWNKGRKRFINDGHRSARTPRPDWTPRTPRPD